jgi:hypothetical protein
LFRYRHCNKGLQSGKYFRIRSDKLANSCKISTRKKRSKVIMFKL